MTACFRACGYMSKDVNKSPEDDTGSPKGGVTGSCEPFNAGARNHSWILPLYEVHVLPNH